MSDTELLSWEAMKAARRARKAPVAAEHGNGANGATPPLPEAGSHYLAAAVADEREQLLATPEGRRNHQLNVAAFNLGMLAPHLIEEDLLRSALTKWGLAAGLELGEVRRTVASGLRDGMARPRHPDLHTEVGTNVTEVDWEQEAALTAEDFAPDDEGVPASVRTELNKLRVRHQARRLFEAELAPKGPPAELVTQAHILATETEPTWRVEGLLPAGGSLLLTAQRKTGKTTLLLNLARSLLTGEPFLGRLACRAVAPHHTVAVLNYEVAGRQLARWGAEAGVPGERMLLANLRGRANPLNDPEQRANLAAKLRAAHTEVLLVDPFGRAFGGADQNSAAEVQQWLTRLDTFARTEAGAECLVLATHAGWSGERTRGSSALEDWPDTVVTMTRDADDVDNGARYLSAIGRDVDLAEAELAFDSTSRRLTLTGGGSRRDAKQARRQAEIEGEVVSTLAAHPGVGLNELGRLLAEQGSGVRRVDLTRAVHLLAERRLVSIEAGPRRSQILHLPGTSSGSGSAL